MKDISNLFKSTKKRCKNCDTEVLRDQNYCHKCGAKIE